MLTIAALLDEFSEACFSPDCNLIPIKSTDYLSRINKSGKIDFLLVESAWRGPGNSWKHFLVNNKKHPVPAGIKHIQQLILACRNKKIPTVFWGKEDPVHFKHFKITAKFFDFIATTDVGCIPEYKKLVGHSRVFSLPFAAQPKIHVYRKINQREFPVCFAGACRDKQYPNRKRGMDIIVKPTIPFGLHIYDRGQAGASGEKFPDEYSSCIKGGVSYKTMLELYGKYRVFLNVNSIDTSDTMFSRRVFELLSCGTPVISSYSPGIVKLLPEVLISKSKEDTIKHLNNLLFNDTYWEEVSAAGRRHILSLHTYAHRLNTICCNLGIKNR